MNLEHQNKSAGNHWTLGWRALIFTLAATSIACLLADFYKIVTMRSFTFFVFGPACIALIALILFDALASRNRVMFRNVALGAAAGFLAACAYDVFRLPFVFAKPWHLAAIVPPMPLFKVFPAFGAMILGTDSMVSGHYALREHVIGWIYHFSNGITFGIMYVALIGDSVRRSWWWGVVMAVGIETALLLTPYTRFFGIKQTPTFVVVTLLAHVVFGVVMGLTVRAMARRFTSASTARLAVA